MGNCQIDFQGEKSSRLTISSTNEIQLFKSEADIQQKNLELRKAIKSLEAKGYGITQILKFEDFEVIATVQEKSTEDMKKFTVKIFFNRLRNECLFDIFDHSPEATIQNEQDKRQLKLEAQNLQKCIHDNIVQIHSYYIQDGISYIFMEECKYSLAQCIEYRHHLSEIQIIEIISELVSGMSYLHQHNLLVGDFNFQNILYDSQNKLKITSLIFNKASLINGKFCLYKKSFYQQLNPIFLPPHIKKIVVQFHEDHDESLFDDHSIIYDQSCDIWGLGILIYILMGQHIDFVKQYGIRRDTSTYKEIPSMSQELNKLAKQMLDCENSINLTIFDIKTMLNNSVIQDAQKRIKTLNDEEQDENQETGVSYKGLSRTNTYEADRRSQFNQKPADKLLFQTDSLKSNQCSQSIKSPDHFDNLDNDNLDKASCIKIGNTYQREQQFDTAEQYYRKALEFDPYYVPAMINLANLYLQNEAKSQQAEEILNNAAKIDSKNTDVYLMLGKYYSQKKMWKQAYDSFSQVYSSDPNNYNNILTMGAILEENKNYKQALQIYQIATQTSPCKATAYIRCAELQLIYSEKESEGKESLKKALQIDSANKIVKLYLGILSRDITLKEDIKRYLEPKKNSIENCKYYLNAGIIFAKYQRNYIAAQHCFEVCIELAELSTPLYNRAVWYLADCLQNISIQKQKIREVKQNALKDEQDD
ncbi:tetratricopeptide repeat protein (macronuclear) [Tetrahymena thermophila SB210]|uniref:Tetratricopeptide repeat protein n=1 Tax=Tetrahymena thermophila (strain SB210) TaxID=312017 RepID=Q22UU1_TETTS|nr:tetratricopeptide repeat protein [Tetrahymena thermophila SB210]EAR89035.1 tetratricopeptide repeat protein [Tetrahymena thermophila SB210]|eukprot:XP_001009280.1 tetratricopeptide repeat protein [Tetrahymena thermophila SB210]